MNVVAPLAGRPLTLDRDVKPLLQLGTLESFQLVQYPVAAAAAAEVLDAELEKIESKDKEKTEK